MATIRGFEEIPHTADWAMRVWAEDLPGLFAEAARGMNSLAGVQLESGPRLERQIELEAGDNESLLVAFLSELLYIQEHENLAFDAFKLRMHNSFLKGELEGAAIAGIAKAIKAVTFHDLRIARSERGFQVQLVFDV